MSETTRTPSRLTLRDHLSSRWVLSWQGLLVTAFIGGIVLVVRESASIRTFGDFSLVRWFLAGILSTPVAFLVLFSLYRPLYVNQKKPLPIWVTPAIYFVLGLVYGLTSIFIADVFGLHSSFPLWQRMLNTAIFSSAWGSALTWYLSVRANAHSRRHQLIEEAVKIEMAKMGQAQLTEIYEKNISRQVSAALADAREAVFADGGPSRAPGTQLIPTSPSDTGQISHLLITAVDESVRPLSAQLRDLEEAAYPKRERFAIINNIMRHTEFNLWLISPIYVYGTARATQEVFGFWPTIRMVFISLLAIQLVLFLANKLMKRFPENRMAIFISATVLAQGVFFLMIPVRNYFIPGTGNLEWALGQALGLVTLIFLVASISAIAKNDEDQQYIFAEQLAADKIQAIAQSRLLVEKAHEMAQHLHGSVQSRLVATALELRRASDRGDWAGVDRALNEAREILTSTQNLVSPADSRLSLQEELRRKSALWDGLCQITLHMETASTYLGTEIPHQAGRVLEEALSNAVRHGRASNVDVTISRVRPQTLRIVVQDNGDGPQKTQGMGGGSAFFDSVSNGNWSLVASPVGATFELLMPLPS